MKKYLLSVKTYITSSPGKELLIGVAIVVSFICLVIAIVSLIIASGPKIDYQPAIACDLLTKEEAKEMLGQNVIAGTPKNPTLSRDIATSKCSYTDMNTDAQAMLVAAIAVQSGVNDKGVARVKATFAASKSGKNVELVNGLGDSAYFNPQLGQLNILDGKNWIILSYGTGQSPQNNTLDNAVTLAQKVLKAPDLPTF